ncbi:hypothetical protein BJD12_21550 [Xanthomonas vesicatoria ATCC 35937]|uniref:Uncharacterized protein n=1 Tax=Xanthomonas vesicatoria ATCC 35937 TaxID=925775 RepID=F0BC32_9XANT|nr:hypothetical protein BJD12_21550 [Xanthomonas vesicatoria ATCC 35937]EGD10014.1 hypothetical protein XVE_1656 [Xanthomonas vesicatoria ATCC 35937]KTF33107.1 hypothetical protein LMG919_16845 [Xanthomonas vesicatoria]KTF34631.1 hypothetical protein LMG920_05555 [Xanthomonas vesicatoria]
MPVQIFKRWIIRAASDIEMSFEVPFRWTLTSARTSGTPPHLMVRHQRRFKAVSHACTPVDGHSLHLSAMLQSNIILQTIGNDPPVLYHEVRLLPSPHGFGLAGLSSSGSRLVTSSPAIH